MCFSLPTVNLIYIQQLTEVKPFQLFKILWEFTNRLPFSSLIKLILNSEQCNDNTEKTFRKLLPDVEYMYKVRRQVLSSDRTH
jgi:hypothetical protein